MGASCIKINLQYQDEGMRLVKLEIILKEQVRMFSVNVWVCKMEFASRKSLP